MVFRLGYDAFQSGWIFAFVGIISAVVQGALIGRLVKRFGEAKLLVAGTLMFTGSLLVIPFIGPAMGLLGILITGAINSVGNALNAPSLASLASKSASASEQGVVLGVTQSVASLARAVGPSIAAFLIYSTIAYVGVDHLPHHMSDASIFRTFWAAALIQFAAFLVAMYFARVHGRESEAGEAAKAA
jgi:DHA1 family tetracycline resistance protein-like MFS transporter